MQQISFSSFLLRLLLSRSSLNSSRSKSLSKSRMDGEIGRTAQGKVQVIAQLVRPMPVGHWRTRLQKHSRQRIVNKMMDALKRNLPFTGQEGLQDLKKIAVRSEEKIYTKAASMPDYLRKISLKMMTLEINSQNLPPNVLQSNAAGNSKNPKDPDSSSQIGNATDEDWQEKTYQKIKAMHRFYYVPLNNLYEQVADKVQELDALPEQPRNEPLDKLRFLKNLLERLLLFLRTNKDDIQPNHKDRVWAAEKQIKNIMNSNRCRNAMQRLPRLHIYATPRPRVSQTHTSEGQLISQMQQMNIQGSSLPTQQNNSTSLLLEQWQRQLQLQLQGQPRTLQQHLIQQLKQQQQQTSELQPQVSQTRTNEGELISLMQQMNLQGSSLPTEQNNSTNEQWLQQFQGQQLTMERDLIQALLQKQKQQQLQGQQITNDQQQLLQLLLQKQQQQQQQQTPQLPSQLHALQQPIE